MTFDLSESEAATVLASLPAMTPRRLRALLYARTPSDVLLTLEAWTKRGSETTGPVDALLSSPVGRDRGRSLGEVWLDSLDGVRERVVARREVCGAPKMNVCVLGDPTYPSALACDPQAPAVLFWRGDLGALNAPRVGIIGTRHATAHGRACARRFGEVLSDHGVAVVSGLARGIDVSAHRGVLGRVGEGCEPTAMPGRPVGVVASGLDVVYPPEHVEIWEEIATHGLLLSESPPGTEPQAYRFPLRNRILAALCNVLVVVESRATGGSMITVRAALERDVTVMAVPGSTATRAAEGTNLLIRDGASIAVEPDDVLAVLGIEAHRRTPHFDPRPRPLPQDGALLDAMGDEPTTLDQICARVRRDLVDVALALGRLEAQGWLMCTAGWFEVCSDPQL